MSPLVRSLVEFAGACAFIATVAALGALLDRSCAGAVTDDDVQLAPVIELYAFSDDARVITRRSRPGVRS